MSDRLRQQDRVAIAKLPQKLKELAKEIEWKASDLDCSFHDAMCYFCDRGEDKDYSDAEVEKTLTAMGSYWE